MSAFVAFSGVFAIVAFSGISASSRRHSLSIGRLSILVLVLTRTCLTNPSEAGMVSMIFPIGHTFLGVDSFITKTRSPTLAFRLGCSHFCLSFSWGRYSRTHLRQNKSARYCTCFQRLLAYCDSFSVTAGGNWTFPFSSSRWFGVNASGSLTSPGIRVIGLPFTIASISHSNVWRLSSVRSCSRTVAHISFLMVLICLSQMPP